MPKPRFSGGSVSMRVSSSQMLPPDSGSRPAMQLSAVDLPQPDGPEQRDELAALDGQASARPAR